MKPLTIVVMAAGMGSRFGGLKQITPIDDENNFIIDYSIYDAKRAGFNKVVFVIKEENLEAFESTIGNRLKDKIEVAYAFQRLTDIPSNIDVSKRIKPWGTVQAILCAKDEIPGAFAVINADDFYGYEAFCDAANFLKNVTNSYTYASIAYPVGVTMSHEGSVKRGVLKSTDNKVSSIIESSIEKKDGQLIASPLDGTTPFRVQEDTPVSMNLFAFQHDFLELLDDYFQEFFKQEEEVIFNSEALLPDCIKENLETQKITMQYILTKAKWIGMTYQSDLDIVKKEINKMKDSGIYQDKLWE